jgi:hypothetical protein
MPSRMPCASQAGLQPTARPGQHARDMCTNDAVCCIFSVKRSQGDCAVAACCCWCCCSLADRPWGPAAATHEGTNYVPSVDMREDVRHLLFASSHAARQGMHLLMQQVVYVPRCYITAVAIAPCLQLLPCRHVHFKSVVLLALLYCSLPCAISALPIGTPAGPGLDLTV